MVSNAAIESLDQLLSGYVELKPLDHPQSLKNSVIAADDDDAIVGNGFQA